MDASGVYVGVLSLKPDIFFTLAERRGPTFG